MKQSLILLPGLLCDAVLWEPQLSELADIADFFAADLTEHETRAEKAAERGSGLYFIARSIRRGQAWYVA